MSQLFKRHLDKFIEIDQEEFQKILSFFEQRQVLKKEDLLQAHQKCNCHYFVLNGCLRKFFINKKGIEQTTEFAIENWWITDNYAFEHGVTSEFYIQAVEKSQVLSIEAEAQSQLLLEFPKMERYFRFVYQRAFAAMQLRLKYINDFSKEEFYEHLCQKQPEFVQRIPQYLIASFLGFTPEYLSEIRSKKRS